MNCVKFQDQIRQKASEEQRDISSHSRSIIHCVVAEVGDEVVITRRAVRYESKWETELLTHVRYRTLGPLRLDTGLV